MSSNSFEDNAEPAFRYLEDSWLPDPIFGYTFNPGFRFYPSEDLKKSWLLLSHALGGFVVVDADNRPCVLEDLQLTTDVEV